ncbi:hypothetical protein Tco_1284526 [Tanacetum coccineum]
MSANDNFSLHDDEELSLHDDASLAGSVPASNKGDAPAKPPQIITTNTLSNIKLPVLQKDDYDTWAMEMEHYLEYIDNEVWKVIQNGNSKKRVTKGKDGVYRVLPPTTQEEQVADEKERKARTLLLMAVPKDHLRRFHGMDDAKEIWAAIKTRFGGNANSKKMQKAVLKQQFEAFTISTKESLEKGYDRFQKLLSQLDALGASVSDEDANHKFLRSLPPAWDSLAMTMRTKKNIDTLHHLLPRHLRMWLFYHKPKPLQASISQATAQEVIVLIPLPLPKQNKLLLLVLLMKDGYKLAVAMVPHKDLEVLQEDRQKAKSGWKKCMWHLDKRKEAGKGQNFKPVQIEKEALMTIDEDSYNALQAKYDELQSEFGDQEGLPLVAHSSYRFLDMASNKLLRFSRIEEEISRGIFAFKETDAGNHDIPLYNRFKQVEYKGVPHPLSGDYTPREQEDIDDSLYEYGKYGPQPQSPSPTESDAKFHSFTQIVTIATQKTQPQVPKPQQTVDPKLESKNEKGLRWQGKLLLRAHGWFNADVRQATPAWRLTLTGAPLKNDKANQFTPRPIQLNNIRPNRSTVSKTVKTGRVNVNTGHGNDSSGSVHVNSGTQIKSGASRFNTGKQHVNSGSVHVNSGTQIKSGASRF